MTGPAAADVIVVGGGLAGSAAALAAAERGATVCLLDKAEPGHGSSEKAGGGLLFAGTRLQREHGVDDSPQALREAIVAAGQGRGDPAAVDAYADNQLATYDWLAGHGQAFTLAPPNADIPVARLHAAPPGAPARLLLGRLAATGRGRVRAGTAARRLITDGGRVTGVVARRDGREAAITARRGVILATGGFTQSPVCWRPSRRAGRTRPPWAGTATPATGCHHGDGLRRHAGGHGLRRGHVRRLGRRLPRPDRPGREARLGCCSRTARARSSSTPRVGGSSMRHSATRSSPGCARQQDGLAFQVFDQAVMDKSVTVPRPRDFAGALADGLIFRAGSLAALAALLRVDPAALEGTVAAYNAAVRDGADPDYGRPLAAASPVGRAPFYGYPCRAGLTTTYCGVAVNRRLQVLDVFGEPIGGLYAAGEVVGGFHGAGDLTGTGLGKAAVFGRVAGITAAG